MMDRTIQNADDDLDDGDLDEDEFFNFYIDGPTREAYVGFYTAWDYFNSALFENKLPACLITMQRRARSRGFFAGEQFSRRQQETEETEPAVDEASNVDEIALNPATFRGRTDREICSTLVHEMTHQWQAHFGTPSRRGYHNREWANKMLELGLVPSNTGEPGGKMTGQFVSHYIKDGGSYDTHWQKLAASGFTLDYQDHCLPGPGKTRKDKVRYTCPRCAISTWGKPGLGLLCKDCLKADLEAANPELIPYVEQFALKPDDTGDA